MNQDKKIARNTTWQIIGKIIGTILGVITIGLLTRYLGAENFGYYTTALAFMQFFGVLVDMGLYMVCLRDMSASPEKKSFILSNIFTLRIITAGLFMGGGALLILVFPYPEVVKTTGLIVSISFFFVSLIQTLTTYFQTELKMGLVAVAEVIGRLSFLLGVIFFIYLEQGLPAIMWANVLNAIIYFLILWLVIKNKIKISWQINLTYWKEVFQKAWPIALGVALNLVYFRMDIIILSLYRPAVEVGLYGAPYKILEIIATFPHMFMGLVMPILTVAWVGKNIADFKQTLQKTFNFFIILGVPMAIGTLPLAEQIMTLIAGPEFVASGPVLAILMLATFFIFIGIIFTYLLVILDKQKAMLKYFLVAAILSLIGYFIFIPIYSYYGAAWVTVIVEVFIVVASWLLFWQTAKIKISFKIFGKALIASLLMAGLIIILPALNIILLILISIFIYLLLMILIKGIDKKILTEMINLKK